MQYNAVIDSITEITPSIRIFRLKPDFGKLDFTAGQFAVLGLPDDPANLDGEWHRRAYSIASPPSYNTVDFYIVLVDDAPPPAPPAKLTPRLWKLKAGDRIFLGEKVAGSMVLPQDFGDKNLLFIATGTGIAPFVSITNDRTKEIYNGTRHIGVIQGARHSSDLGFKGFFDDDHKENPKTRHYYPTVSRPYPGRHWEGFTGRVGDVLDSGIVEQDFGRPITPENTLVFLCGNPNMVDDMVARFEALGFTRNTPWQPGNLFFDKH